MAPITEAGAAFRAEWDATAGDGLEAVEGEDDAAWLATRREDAPPLRAGARREATDGRDRSAPAR
jgi:hypothetical protein